MSGAFILTNVTHRGVWSNCSYSTDFHACSQDSFSRQIHFPFHRHPLASLLPDLAEPDYCLWYYVKSK